MNIKVSLIIATSNFTYDVPGESSATPSGLYNAALVA